MKPSPSKIMIFGIVHSIDPDACYTRAVFRKKMIGGGGGGGGPTLTGGTNTWP